MLKCLGKGIKGGSMIYFMYFKRDDIIYKIQLKQSRKRHLQHARHQALSLDGAETGASWMRKMLKVWSALDF